MKQPKPNAALSALPGDYANLLSEVKQRVRSAQIRAAMAASAELLALHWDIGRMILDRQKREGWGAKVIDRLAADLQGEFPGRQGFSPRNLKYMRAFAEAWPGGVFVQPAVAQMGGNPIVQQAAAQLPWMHHCLLLDRLKTTEDRLWYTAKAVENGWSLTQSTETHHKRRTESFRQNKVCI
jgi:predicted nuclease of restriction endonuclease-like (RecB) superfamily